MIARIKPRYAILAILFIMLIAYAGYEGRALLLGPRISITSPVNRTAVSEPLVIMEGESWNISWISLNGRQIFTDKDGHWSEKLLVSPGLSIMTLEARDRFGRKTEKQLQIVLK
mgnify:CR=1 FL=1